MFPKKTFLSLAILTVLASSFLMPTSFGMKGAYPGLNGMIAFNALDSVEGDEEIYIMNNDGTGIQQVTFDEDNNWEPCWSPDSEKIAFAKYHDLLREIYYIHKDGTGLTQVTTCPEGFSHSAPAWSPDGEKIAYSRYHHYPPSERDVYVIQIGAGGEGVKLIENAESPSWSPDGSMIAYTNRTESPLSIWVANSNTGMPLFKVTNGTRPCWSPDGQRIAYHNSTSEAICVVDIDGSNQQQISFPPPGYSDYNPNWSPDGSKILFQRVEDSIWIMNSDGLEPYDLTPNIPSAENPDWARAEPSVGGEILPTNMWIPWLIPLLALLSIGAIFAVRKKTLH